MSALEDFYKNLKVDDLKHFYLPLSDIFYARAAIREATGQELELLTVEQLLFSEGLMPARNYSIPSWYRKKWMPDKPSVVTEDAEAPRPCEACGSSASA